MRCAHVFVVALCTSCMAAGTLDRSEGFSGGTPKQVEVRDVPVHGHNVEVEDDDGTTSGELLAVDVRYLYVLSDGETVAVRRAKVRRVTIEIHDSGGGIVAAWTALGTISTLSHGFYLVISAPAWVISGVSAGIGGGANNDLHVPPEKLSALHQFARFPQGLPLVWPAPNDRWAPPMVRAPPAKSTSPAASAAPVRAPPASSAAPPASSAAPPASSAAPPSDPPPHPPPAREPRSPFR